MVAEKSATPAWWSSSTTQQGAIPPPPQVREEAQRAEAIRLDEQKRKAERERRAAEARERQARQVAQRELAAATAVSETEGHVVRDRRRFAGSASASTGVKSTAVDCQRCGTPLESTASGQGFSFCLLCGAEAPVVERRESHSKQAFGAEVYTGSAVTTNSGVNVVQTETAAPIRKSNRSPVMAAVFSFILPGIGQCLNGQAAKGALLLLVYFLASTVFTFLPLGIPMLIVRGVAAADAFRIAEKRRKGVAVRDGEWDLG